MASMRALLIVLLLFLWVPGLAEDAPIRRQQFVDANGSKLHVEMFGKGRPVLFLHGGLHYFGNSFAKLGEALAGSHLVIGLDQRGHGHSPDDARPFRYAEMAEDTAEVLRKLDVGPVDVVGHSDGANVALLLARMHPERVRRIVVAGPNLRPSVAQDEARRRLSLTDDELKPFLDKIERNLPARFRTEYEAVTPDGAEHWPVVLMKSYRLWLTPTVIEAADLASIQAPVLVMAGDKDFAPLEETTELYRGLPNAQLFIVPGAGHGTFADRPELVNLAIRQFLDAP